MLQWRKGGVVDYVLICSCGAGVVDYVPICNHQFFAKYHAAIPDWTELVYIAAAAAHLVSDCCVQPPAQPLHNARKHSSASRLIEHLLSVGSLGLLQCRGVSKDASSSIVSSRDQSRLAQKHTDEHYLPTVPSHCPWRASVVLGSVRPLKNTKLHTNDGLFYLEL